MYALDYSIIEEQGQFPTAQTPKEERVYAHLVMVEVSQIQWRFKALTYLSSLIDGNKSAQLEGEEDREPGEVYPKLWKYLSFRNLLMPIEIRMQKEDPYTSAATRLLAATTTYDNWKAQQKWARKPNQSPAKSRSRVDTTRPTLA